MTAPTAIHLRVHDVGMHFLGLTQALRDSPEYAAQANPECIVEEFDRFKIWAANISAHREGQQSLENRLRDAAHLKDHTISLLDELQRSLERGRCPHPPKLFPSRLLMQLWLFQSAKNNHGIHFQTATRNQAATHPVTMEKSLN